MPSSSSSPPFFTPPSNLWNKDFVRWLHNGKRDNLDDIDPRRKNLLHDFQVSTPGDLISKLTAPAPHGAKLHCTEMDRPVLAAFEGEKRILRMRNLQAEMDDNYIRGCFAHAGEILSVKRITDKLTGMVEGLIEFSDHAAAQEIFHDYNGMVMPNTRQYYNLSWAPANACEKGIDGTGVGFQLHVHSLDPKVTHYSLQETFKNRYPSVISARVIKGSNAGLVWFGDVNERKRAVSEINGWSDSTKPMHASQAPYIKTEGSNLLYANSDSIIFVASTGHEISANFLWDTFSKYGKLARAEVLDATKRCGFVQFANKDDMYKLSGSMLGILRIWLPWVEQPKEHDSKQWNGSYFDYENVNNAYQQGYKQGPYSYPQIPHYGQSYYGYGQGNQGYYVRTYPQIPQYPVGYAYESYPGYACYPSQDFQYGDWGGYQPYYGAQPHQEEPKTGYAPPSPKSDTHVHRTNQEKEVCDPGESNKDMKEESSHKSKQTRSEKNTMKKNKEKKKINKAMRKLRGHALASFNHIILDEGKNISIVVSKAEVFRSADSDMCFISGNMKFEDMTSQMQTQIVDRSNATNLSDATPKSEELSMAQKAEDEEARPQPQDTEMISRLTETECAIGEKNDDLQPRALDLDHEVIPACGDVITSNIIKLKDMVIDICYEPPEPETWNINEDDEDADECKSGGSISGSDDSWSVV